jgi:uncharacterized MAPEG superfamily protein
MTVLLLCVLTAAVMPVACAGIAKAGRFSTPRRDGGYDNHLPREWLARQSGYRARANAAQANCFEALPLFIGAVAIALALEAPQARLDVLALAWVGLRLAYVACYLADRALARSAVWALALAVNVAILFASQY